jgi:DHA1 family bicyclomycin/chloramphenicol resistance-like MFS transporter
MQNTSTNNRLIILIIVLSLFPLSGMTIDLFAPSLPAISTALQISGSVTKLIISLYVLGYAFGNCITGLLTDALGRKSLLRISCLLFIIASFAPIIFPNETVLLTARFFQGLFMGGIAVLCRTILSDILPPNKLVKLGPTVGFLWGLGPVIGPILGGYLQYYFNWKAGFYFFGIITTILFVAICIYIPETIEKKSKLRFSKIKNDIKEVLSNSEFMSLVVVMGCAYALIITFNTLGPFLIQDKMHYSPLFFGKLGIFLGLAFIPAPIICRYLLNHLSVGRLFSLVIHWFLTAISILLTISIFFDMSLIIILLASVAVYFVCGAVFPLSLGKGLSMFKHISGTAAAVMYLINMLIASLVAFSESFISTYNVTTIISVYVCLMLVMVALYRFKLHKL